MGVGVRGRSCRERGGEEEDGCRMRKRDPMRGGELRDANAVECGR
jgi:hypothetical protein